MDGTSCRIGNYNVLSATVVERGWVYLNVNYVRNCVFVKFCKLMKYLSGGFWRRLWNVVEFYRFIFSGGGLSLE